LNRISQSSAIALTILLITSRGFGVPAEWKDASKHIIRFVEVEPGVRLEVLDWGGSGEPLMLLAGHGNTGHVFDDFAPRLTDGFRVFAITRRGFGASSQPTQGYDLARMVEDIARVTHTLKLGRVNVAGHSIAGDEMTRLALTYPDNVGKLVYLEAAYDRVEAQRLEGSFPKLPQPPPEARESGSAEAVRSLVARTEILMPESEIRATRIFGPDGQYLRPVTPESIVRAIAKMVEHPDYRAVRAPILAIYAVYRTAADLSPRYKTADSETRQGLDQIFALWQSFAHVQRELLRKSVPQARVDEIRGANHYVFISNRDQVLKDMHIFLTAH
jgi:pimeloyl-ACP methyl ester carboxylesterase